MFHRETQKIFPFTNIPSSQLPVKNEKKKEWDPLPVSHHGIVLSNLGVGGWRGGN